MLDSSIYGRHCWPELYDIKLFADPVGGRSSFHLRSILFPAELCDLQKQLIFVCVYTSIMTSYDFCGVNLLSWVFHS